jgi:oxygen-independent coproporphyrinogen III oxidase
MRWAGDDCTMNSQDIFAARVPRYTSYPTAPHFHPGIDGGTHRGWLAALDPQLPLSLYVHIPFCDSLCWFCGCHTKAVNGYAPLAAYLDALETEIARTAEALGARRQVTHIHWGGGSPTMLKPHDMRQLGALLRSHFDVAAGAEFAVEIDPRGFTAEMAEALAAIGVNRASIGVQDFAPDVQRAINRMQDFETTANCVGLLRANGIDRLNIDLIYGLPHQSVKGLVQAIGEVLSLSPDRLAIFGYAHVPSFKKHQNLIPEAALPDLDARFRQAEAAQEQVRRAGYAAIGLDHFAKPDDAMARAAQARTLKRNFQGYTTDDAAALIGFGASAISSLPQGYAQNIVEVPAWRTAVADGRLPVARGIALDDEDRIRSAVIERLMCDLTVDLAVIASAYGRQPAMFADALASLQPYARDGIVEIDGWRIRVPERWRAAVRVVCAAFDTYLAAGTARHSAAV